MRNNVKKTFAMLITIAGLTGVLASSNAVAGNFGVDINDEVARVFIMQKIRQSNLSGNFSVLHQEDGGNIVAGGLHVVEQYGPGSFLGLGGQVFAYDADLDTGFSLDDSGVVFGVGGFGRWAFPTLSALGIGADVYYAPSVLAFGDTDSYLEYALRLEFHALRSTDIYVGYRRIEIEIADFGDVDFEKGAFVGARLTF